MQEPVAVLVDRRPVAVRPDAGEAAPVRLEVALVVAPDAARHPGPGPAADELADLAAHAASPVGVDDVHVLAERGEAERDRLDRLRSAVERKHAPTSVPPLDVHDRLRRRRRRARRASGTGRGSTARRSCRSARSDERSARGSPFGISARTSVGERPSIVTRSDSTSRQSRSSASRARPRRRRSSRRARRAPTTVHGPMIQPMSVAKWTRSPALHVGLVGDLARDRDEEAALDVQRALRPARSCPTCRRAGTGPRSRPRPAERRPAAASRARATSRRRRRFHSITCSTTARRGAPRRASRASAIALAAAKRPVGADHDLRLRVLEPRGDRGRGEAGEDRHLHGADVRAACEAIGDRRATSACRSRRGRPRRRRARRAPRRAASPGARARAQVSDSRRSPSS